MSKTTKKQQPLCDVLKSALENYFVDLEGAIIGNIYDFVLSEVEQPLLEVVLDKAGGNQTKAAKWLGISRNTLRKLVNKYEL